HSQFPIRLPNGLRGNRFFDQLAKWFHCYQRAEIDELQRATCKAALRHQRVKAATKKTLADEACITSELLERSNRVAVTNRIEQTQHVSTKPEHSIATALRIVCYVLEPNSFKCFGRFSAGHAGLRNHDGGVERSD